MATYSNAPRSQRTAALRKLICSAFLAVGILALSLAGGRRLIAAGAPLCVSPQGSNGCYTHIQDAVNAASSGAIVSVRPGTYHEMVTINKPLTLSGSPDKTSVIDARGLDHAIFVSGTQNVQVLNMTAKNANLSGILVQDSDSVSLNRVAVSFNDKNLDTSGPEASCAGAPPFQQDDCGEGINLVHVSNSTVINSTVQNNAGGILLSDETGETHDNRIQGNTVQFNILDCGITLASHAPGNGVDHNTIIGNTSTGNGGAGTGIFTPIPGTQAHDNVVTDNTLTNNDLPGVALHSHAPGQNLNNNTITHNVIHGNAADDDANTGVPTGIVIFSDGPHGAAPITGTTISDNTISAEGIDIFVGTGNATSPVIHNNKLLNNVTNNAVGVDNQGTATVDATSNFWGCSGGPGAHGCTTVEGNVTYQPFLP